MVDFTKKIKNSDKFRGPALEYIRSGVYCSYPRGTTEYIKFWEEEQERCINGYTASDGDRITGYYYFYLNYCPILRIVNRLTVDKDGKQHNKRGSELTFPDFYDYDYYYYNSVQLAEDEGKHLCVIKSRRKGYSYKGGSMACRNYYLIPNSKTYVYASNKQYLTEDGILTKAWEYMDFIDKNTAWGKKRTVSTTMRRRAAYIITDEFGNKIECGYKSEIIGVSLKDNPDALRGKRAKLILFEEGGTFSELGAAWQIARPSVEQDGLTFGLMIVWGTGGDEGSAFATLKDMFYHPDGYNCLGFKNIWDDDYSDNKCGFFIPQYTNLDNRDEFGNRIYMDNDGNTIHKPSLQFILEERRKVTETATSTTAIDRYVAERPVTPKEAMLEFNGNIFPKKEMQMQLSYIRTNKKLHNQKHIGDLVWEQGIPKWIPKKTGDITQYPLPKDADPTGSIVIWEHPMKDPPIGLYIAGCDPYDHDQSGTNSLGSTFIYKRIQSFEEYYEMPVAEYTGRPETAEAYYENVRKLLVYYNARLLYENERKGIFPYFTSKHCDYLLADQPDIIKDIVGKSGVNRQKGIHMSKPIKDWMEGLIKEWLCEEYAPGKKNLTKLLSEPLLEELISYNDTGNFDRVIAFGLLMVYREQLHNLHVKDKKKVQKKLDLFGSPIFSDTWWGNTKDDSIDNDRTNTTTEEIYTF